MARKKTTAIALKKTRIRPVALATFTKSGKPVACKPCAGQTVASRAYCDEYYGCACACAWARS